MYNPVYATPSVFANTPYYIAESVKRMLRKPNFGFQFEMFDLGFLDNVARWRTADCSTSKSGGSG